MSHALALDRLRGRACYPQVIARFNLVGRQPSAAFGPIPPRDNPVYVTLLVTVFLGSVERGVSRSRACMFNAIARSLDQDWPEATGEAGA